MSKKIKDGGFLSDGMGNKSSTRLMAMFCLFTAILITIVSVACVTSDPEPFGKLTLVFLFVLIALFLILAFMPKVLQKMIEKAIDIAYINSHTNYYETKNESVKPPRE